MQQWFKQTVKGITWAVMGVIISTGSWGQEAVPERDIKSAFPSVSSGEKEAAAASASASVPIAVGFRDHSYGSEVVSSVTGEKPESKLWWNDGRWWGSLWDPETPGYYIYRFDKTTQSWENTGVALDNRSDSKADILWDGTHLYVASHIYSAVGQSAGSGHSARLYRFSYNSAGQTYTLDADFPVVINDARSEALVLDKDSRGKLWITWVEGRRVMVNCSQGDDLSWGDPFQLPVQGGNLAEDDISALAAFDENKIGLIWTNQNTNKTYFAVHRDGQPDDRWESRELALGNQKGIIDDHVNFNTACDGSGNLYAVIKTSFNSADDPQIILIKRDPQGNWSDYEVGKGRDDHTRPILVLDSDRREIYVFATQKYSGNNRIIYKKAALDDLSFPAGDGTPFLQSDIYVDINNASASKQCVTGQSGLLVLASDKTSQYYFHNHLNFVNVAPLARDDSVTTAEDTPVTIAVLENDRSGSGDPLTISAVLIADTRGEIELSDGDSLIEYRPPPDSSGVDYFQYVIRDGSGAADTAAVVITISPVNDPPLIEGLPARISLSDSTTETLDIWAAAEDIETADSALTFAFHSLPDTLALDYQADEGLLTIAARTPVSSLMAQLVITVEDPEGVQASDTIAVQLLGIPVGIDDGLPEIPRQYLLQQNFPNPFNPVTTIRFGLPQPARVTVMIFDLLGQAVQTLVDGDKPAGYHQISFDGSHLPSGIYFYRLQVNDLQFIKRMTLIK